MKKAGIAIVIGGAYLALACVEPMIVTGIVAGLALALAGGMMAGAGAALEAEREEEERRNAEHREKVFRTWMSM